MCWRTNDNPQKNIDKEAQRGIADCKIHKCYVNDNNANCQQQQDDERFRRTPTQTHHAVMNMRFVWKKRIFVMAQTHDDNMNDVKQWNKQRTCHENIPTFAERFPIGLSMPEMHQKQTNNVAEAHAASISHKQFMSSRAKDIVTEKDAKNANRRNT